MSTAPRQPDDAQLDKLVVALRTGDNRAWGRVVARYDRTLRAIARSYRLGPADVDDVVQLTWTRLYEHVDRLREPNAIGGWLATTTRRESMHLLQAARREQPSDDPEFGEAQASHQPEAVVLAAEKRAVLGRALGALPDRDRRLMTLLAIHPDASYRHICATLDMPIGSIGPIRARGLTRLSRDPDLQSYYYGVAGTSREAGCLDRGHRRSRRRPAGALRPRSED